MNLPNKITLTRIALVPAMVALMIFPYLGTQVAAAVVFLFASLSDLLDGYLARKYNLITDFGKFVDPIADKLLITAAMVMLVSDGRMHPVVVLLFIAREFVISAFRMLAASKGTVIAAGKLGKYKTAAQTVAVLLLMLLKPVAEIPALLGTPGIVASEVVTYIALALSIASCIDYMLKNKQVL